MPQGGTPYLIPFGSAGMVAHPNRWRAQAGELLLGENVVVENDLLNKEPAATYYDQAGVDLLQMKGTWNVNTEWLAIASWFRARSDATSLTSTSFTATNAAPPTIWTVPVTTGG